MDWVKNRLNEKTGLKWGSLHKQVGICLCSGYMKGYHYNHILWLVFLFVIKSYYMLVGMSSSI